MKNLFFSYKKSNFVTIKNNTKMENKINKNYNGQN